MKFHDDGIHMNSQKKSIREPLILGALIKIDNSSISSTSVSTISSVPSTTEKDASESKDLLETKSLSRLPRSIDPNLGLTGYLSTLSMAYETKMNQPWNIAPYFLDILTQSPCCDLSDCILLFGGLDTNHPDDFVLGSSVFEYHITYKKWRYYGCMLEPRCYHATSQTNSFVYVTGGYSLLQRYEGEMIAVAATDRLDINNTIWGHCADMKTARTAHAMVAVNENLYVFGGRDSNGNFLTSVEIYNPHENAWTEISHLPVPLMGLAATYVGDKIWLVGGITAQKPGHQNASVVATVYSFSPSNKSWCTEEPLPGPHAFSSCVSNNNSIWIAGGSHFSKSQANKTLVSCPCIWQLSFHTKTRTWKKVGYLPVPTHGGAAVLCGDLLISLGGIHSLSRNVTNAVQVFNTKTNSFEQSVKLPARIVGASAVYFPRKTMDDKGMHKYKNTIPPNKEMSKRSDDQVSSVAPQTTTSEELTATDNGSVYSQHELDNKINDLTLQKLRNAADPIHTLPPYETSESGTYDKDSSTLQDSDSSVSMITRAGERKFKDVSKANETYPEVSNQKPANLAAEIEAKIEKSLPRTPRPSATNLLETFTYVKELPASSTRQYVTTLEIPLNGEKVYESHDLRKSDFVKTEGMLDTDLSESESSGSGNFKLYSPPTKWKERSKKLKKSE